MARFIYSIIGITTAIATAIATATANGSAIRYHWHTIDTTHRCCRYTHGIDMITKTTTIIHYTDGIAITFGRVMRVVVHL